MASLSHLQEDLPPEQVAKLLEENGAQLVDVREPHEHEAGRIGGARWIEMHRLTAEAETLDRERQIVFYCRSGGRSSVAAQAFRASGYDAYNMDGGILAWVERGLPIEPDDGHVAKH